MILGRQPEKRRDRRALRFEVALHSDERGQLREGVQRTAGEADLLAGDDGDRLAALPSLERLAGEDAPLLVGFGQRSVDENAGYRVGRLSGCRVARKKPGGVLL